ncbi:MAG: hypothetical protein IKU27_03235 [Clostridia bacterium]|nr:hypothetical protein [Clostridia bacterium]
MAAMNKWDEEQYRRNMNAVAELCEAARKRYDLIRPLLSETFTCYGVNYDYWGKTHSGIEQFATALGRLNNLHESMKSYLQEYNEMLENAQGTMEGVTVNNTVYGTFGALVAGGTALAAAYSGSTAWHYYNTQVSGSQQNYFDRYNDLMSFAMSGVFNDAMDAVGKTEIANYDLYVQFFTGNSDAYAQERLEEALSTMLDSMPGASNMSLTSMDWAKLGELLGIEGLEKIGAELDKLLKEFQTNGRLSDEHMKRLQVLFEELKNSRDIPSGMVTLIDKMMPFIEKGEVLLGPGVDLVNLFLSYMNTYTEQLSYLETMESALANAGIWSGSQLSATIDRMKETYSDAVFRSFNEVLDIGGDIVGDIVGYSLTSQIPVIKNVDFGLKVMSASATLGYGIERVAAVKEMMGIMQYGQPLLNSCKYYAQMMEQGIATAADVAEADRLFEMLHATKIKEYECIKTITEAKFDLPDWLDKYTESDRWYDLACEKLEELKKIDPSDRSWIEKVTEEKGS